MKVTFLVRAVVHSIAKADAMSTTTPTSRQSSCNGKEVRPTQLSTILPSETNRFFLANSSPAAFAATAASNKSASAVAMPNVSASAGATAVANVAMKNVADAVAANERTGQHDADAVAANERTDQHVANAVAANERTDQHNADAVAANERTDQHNADAVAANERTDQHENHEYELAKALQGVCCRLFTDEPTNVDPPPAPRIVRNATVSAPSAVAFANVVMKNVADAVAATNKRTDQHENHEYELAKALQGVCCRLFTDEPSSLDPPPAPRIVRNATVNSHCLNPCRLFTDTPPPEPPVAPRINRNITRCCPTNIIKEGLQQAYDSVECQVKQAYPLEFESSKCIEEDVPKDEAVSGRPNIRMLKV